jgi:hypothetical protein
MRFQAISVTSASTSCAHDGARGGAGFPTAVKRWRQVLVKK